MRDNLRYRVCILYFKSMSILSIRDLFLEFLLLEQHSYCCDFSSCSILSSRTWLVYSKLIRNVFSSLSLCPQKSETKESKRKHRKDKSEKKEKHEKERKKEKRKGKTSEKSDSPETAAAEPENQYEPTITELEEEKKQVRYKVILHPPRPTPTKSVYETPPSHPPHPVCDSHMDIPLCACNFSSRRFLSSVFLVSVLIHVCVSACHHNVQSSCRKRLSQTGKEIYSVSDNVGFFFVLFFWH